MNPQRQEIVDALPTTGEMSYDALRTKLVAAGKEVLLQHFHAMRREGQVKVRIDRATGALFVARA